MRGAGGCGAIGRAAIGGEGGTTAVTEGGAETAGICEGGVCAAGGGVTKRGATGDDATDDGGAGGMTIRGATTGAGIGAEGALGAGFGNAAGGRTSGGATIVGRLTAAGGAITDFSAGACTAGAVGRTGVGAAAGGAALAASFFCVIARSTSPGREMFERSILVLISSSPRKMRELDLLAADEPSAEERMYTRTFSASCSSRELECVFFSVTPTSGSVSRIALLFTSSSRARSLIRTLLIRPFVSPRCS